jgi:predicted amidohydrolase YtcJ
VTLLLRAARVVPLGADAGRGAGTGGDAGFGGDAAVGRGAGSPPATAGPRRGGDGPLDLRVDDGLIREVAPSLAPEPGEDVVDLAGRWILPGLWDAHVHLSQWAAVRRRLDVSGASSAAEVASLVRDRLRADVAAGAVPERFVAFGFRDGTWPDVPTPQALDAAAADAGVPGLPVVVVCGDWHSAWLGTSAGRWLGVPAGRVTEAAWFAVATRLDPDEATLDAGVADAAAAAAARGVVGVVDYELADNLAAWHRRIDGGLTGLRVEAGVWREHLDGVLARELASGDPVPGTAGLLTQGSLKVISDGSLNTRTAACHEPYPGLDGTPGRGVLNVPPDELLPLMAAAARHGVHAAIHAIGDRANTLALDAFEATGARGSIEHAQLLAEADVARFARLGIAASVQPEHVLDDCDVLDAVWGDRADRTYPFRTLHDAGVRLLLGSDAPVAQLDPWFAVAAAVTRTRGEREPWHPEQALPRDVALAASVRTRVAAGRPADLVVLDADPLACGAATLRAMPVAATLLAGRWTHGPGW